MAVSVVAHAMLCDEPQATRVMRTPSSPCTRAGFLLTVVVPSPCWPWSLSPHANTCKRNMEYIICHIFCIQTLLEMLTRKKVLQALAFTVSKLIKNASGYTFHQYLFFYSTHAICTLNRINITDLLLSTYPCLVFSFFCLWGCICKICKIQTTMMHTVDILQKRFATRTCR